MAITYSWSFSQLECVPSEGDKSNIVKIVHWTLEGTDGEYSDQSYGTLGLASPEGEFIDYDDLTEADIAGWVEDRMDETGELDGVKAAIARRIGEQRSPSIVTPPLPWA